MGLGKCSMSSLSWAYTYSSQFASIVTVTSTFVCAIVINEISERALKALQDFLELSEAAQTLEELVQEHGNAALRLAWKQKLARMNCLLLTGKPEFEVRSLAFAHTAHDH